MSFGSRRPTERMPGLQPENDGFNSLREQFISVWRNLAARVPRGGLQTATNRGWEPLHEIEGSNPSTLTLAQVAERKCTRL